jgi:dipeptidyl aminopeptidase/acylaminoacyl peptidase
MFAKRPNQSMRALLAIALLSACGAQAAPASIEPTELARIAAANRALSPAPLLDEADFSRRSPLREVKLAPNGSALAFMEMGANGASVSLLDLRTGQKKQLLSGLGRSELHWSTDSSTLFVDSGDALSVVSPRDGASTRIASFDRKARQQFADIDASQPHHALIDETDPKTGIYRLSRVAANGQRELLYVGKPLLDYLLDEKGQLTFIRTRDEHFEQVVSRQQDGKWVEAARCEPLRACSLVAATGNKLDMIVNVDGDRRSLVELDLRKHTRRVLHADPLKLADLKQVVLSPRTRAPLLAVYTAPQRRNAGLTPSTRAAAADIANRFPDANITVTPSTDATHWLLAERGARLPQERYWIYDGKQHSFAEVLQTERTAGKPLPEEQFARTAPVDYRASDGALVHGYLTLPPGKDAASLPLLTMVHGGPWASFGNDYNTLVQLLANRGYAVFQPNFRSSTGYGDKYMLAPGTDFGNGRAQADIIDGVRWLVAGGIGDRKRLGIMGDSFGGYSTLLALTHTPDLFQFGMAMSAPPDFANTMRVVADSGAIEGGIPFTTRLAALGVALDDAAGVKAMHDAAPAALAERVTRPLLIIAGARDDKVAINDVTAYVARLQEHQRPVSLLVAPDEGHMPRKAITRDAYLYLLQRMLHQYLGGPEVPAPSAALAAYLQQNMKANGALAL